MPSPIRVIVVDDDREIRELLRGILERSEGLTVVGAFSEGETFLRDHLRLQAHVVVMDINMPGKDGIECVREAKLQRPETQFLMSTVFENPAYTFKALCAGATGYLVKNSEPEEIVAAVREIHAGGSPMSPAIARMVVDSLQKDVQQRIQDERLTDREKLVLDQLANGLMYKEIAAKAEISTETVRKHVHNIYSKLQVRSRMEAIRKVYPDR